MILASCAFRVKSGALSPTVYVMDLMLGALADSSNRGISI